ncbi:hypothetical protein [Actinoplanes solisilvae]|uniref:hypothetical protein n=1 Tax=Actinoplanes solisilvae TaxID=2486853 RepID=UPI000FD8A228|nr:hypothetical protein [Actinoplanes solisilvae]
MRAPLRVGILVAVLMGSGCTPAPDKPALDVLHRAEEVLVRDCMARQGFTYEPRPRTPAPDVERFPYVVDDLEWARANGYGRAERRQLEQEASSTASYYGGLPKEQQKAWLAAYHGDRASGLKADLPFGGTVGHSDQGCAARAWQDLYGDMREWFRVSRITDALGQMRVGQTSRDERYVAARKRWQECMSAEGFAAGAPLSFRIQQLEYEGADAEARDRAAAMSEARCAARSELSTVARQLDAANASALEKKYRAEYDTAERLRQAALPRARDVLTRSSDHLVSQ